MTFINAKQTPADQLRVLRKQRGQSLRSFARDLKVPFQHLWLLEQGAPPWPKLRQKLVKRLGVDPWQVQP